MPQITDTDIRRWYVDAADNGPTDGEFIGRNLGRQWRNIKSIARIESLDKEFEKRAWVTATSSTSGGGNGTITITGQGNLSSTLSARRKLRLSPQSGGDAIYAAVQSVSYNGGSDTNTVTLIELTDTIGTNVAYDIDLGVVHPGSSCLPGVHEYGEVTISGASTSGTASFTGAMRRGNSNAFYFVKTQIVSSDAGAPSDIVTRIVKGQVSFDIHLKSAPGVGNNTVVAWQAFREMP